MIFVKTPLEGAIVIQIERNEDARGFFSRLWCREEFKAHGLEIEIAQVSMSHNRAAGTVRGMHFQWPPSREAKLVRCQRGRIHDVIVDLRPKAATYTEHFSVALDADRHNALYIPQGIAHGFQTLVDDSDVVYMMSDYYDAALQAGVRWNDPAFSIAWPIKDATILPRDAGYPDFDARVFAADFARRTVTLASN